MVLGVNFPGCSWSWKVGIGLESGRLDYMLHLVLLGHLGLMRPMFRPVDQPSNRLRCHLFGSLAITIQYMVYGLQVLCIHT